MKEDIKISQMTTTERGLTFLRRISWGAILGGTLIALVIYLVLNLLGFGIGLGTIDPIEENVRLAALGTGSLIWMMAALLISLFIGGWMTARLSGIPKRSDSVMHGLLTFSLFTLILFTVMASAIGKIVSGITGAIGNTVSTVGTTVANLAPEAAEKVQTLFSENDMSISEIKKEAKELLQQTGKPELQPQAMRNTARQATSSSHNPQTVINNLFSKGKDVIEEADREAAINVIIERTGKSRSEATQLVDGWIAVVQDGKQKIQEATAEAKEVALKAADETADALSKAAIFGFFGLLLGAIAAAIGGGLGRPSLLAIAEEERSAERNIPVI